MRESYEANIAENKPNAEILSKNVPAKVFNVAMRVCKQKCRPLDDLIDDEAGFDNLVSDEDWQILGANEMNETELAEKKHQDWLKKQKAEAAKEAKKKTKKKMKKSAKVDYEYSKKKGDDEEEYDEEYDDEDYYEEDAGEEDEEEKEAIKKDKQRDTQISNRYPEFKECLEVIVQLKKDLPQFNMDGERNIWIMKPAGSSRGRGICLQKNLN